MFWEARAMAEAAKRQKGPWLGKKEFLRLVVELALVWVRERKRFRFLRSR
jgi:hypothetical protein